jgi:curved DNA-binding protein CbpA
MNDDPFRVLGLPRRADLSDDDVRGAWRRIAAATHPDRDDGGDPARFGAAAAAYAMLRTAYDRGEALADLGLRGGPRAPGQRAGRARALRGRPGVVAARVLLGAAVSVAAFAVAGWTPASLGVLAGSLTWLIATGRHDLGRDDSGVMSAGRAPEPGRSRRYRPGRW